MVTPSSSLSKVELEWSDVIAGHFPETPARQLFHNTVIDVAAQANAALPEANGRVDRARDVVLGGLVQPGPDGAFVVRSQSARGKSYTITESACECPDAEKLVDGRCKHLIATWIWRKARKALEQQLASEGNGHQATVQPAETPKAEAPASCNVYVMLAGRKVQMTLRDSDEARLLARLETLLKRFPVADVAEASEAAAQPQGEHWCRTHQAYMKKRQWGGYSHKTAEGWCHGK